MLSKRSRFTFALGAVALIGLAVRIIYVLGWKNPVKPAEIAGVIAHLLSEDSAPISGAGIPVYGRA